MWYRYILHHEPPTTNKRKNQTKEQHTLVQPPIQLKNVSTNIADRFLTLVEKHFPRDHKPRKILIVTQSKSVTAA